MAMTKSNPFHGDREHYEDRVTHRTVIRVWYQPKREEGGRWVSLGEWESLHKNDPDEEPQPQNVVPDFVMRMDGELRELDKKIEALSRFLSSPHAATLTKRKQDLLRVQLGAMQAYSGALSMRLEFELIGE